MSITYTDRVITVKAALDGEVVEQEVEASVAEGVGLAYLIDFEELGGEPIITITHIHSGVRVGGDWSVSSEPEAQAWIAALDDVMDWTKAIPQIRPGKSNEILHLACVGALHESWDELQKQSSDEDIPQESQGSGERMDMVL
jgi:hypothetical protein